MSTSDLKRIKEMESELSRIKRMYADMALENQALKDLIEKKALRPSDKREAVTYLIAEHRMSVQRSCRCIGLSRAAYYRSPVAQDRNAEVIDAINSLLAKHPRWGAWKCWKYLYKSHRWNHKRVYRIYSKLNLNQKRRAKKRLPKRVKQPLLVPHQPNQVWSADFMSDSLYASRRFRTFNVIDDFNRELLHVEIDTSKRLIRVFERLRLERGLPKTLRTDNGPEFLSGEFIFWAEQHGMSIQYIQPGKLNEVRETTYWWKIEYNEQRPHDALGDLRPVEYLSKNAGNSIFQLST